MFTWELFASELKEKNKRKSESVEEKVPTAAAAAEGQ